MFFLGEEVPGMVLLGLIPLGEEVPGTILPGVGVFLLVVQELGVLLLGAVVPR